MPPFDSVLQAVKWYRLVKQQGLPSQQRGYRVRPRVSATLKLNLDVLWGEPAAIWNRLDHVIQSLREEERILLLTNRPEAVGLKTPNQMYKRQHALRAQLQPVFEHAGLIELEGLDR